MLSFFIASEKPLYSFHLLLSTTLSGKSIRYTSTSVPSLVRLRRLLEAGNSARYLRTWGGAHVRNPCQKIARSEEFFWLNVKLRLDLNQWLFSWQACMHPLFNKFRQKTRACCLWTYSLPAPLILYPHMPLSATLSGKSIRYESTSVPSLARLQRLLEAGNSARYLRTSWGRVRNPCQKIARSEDYKSSKIFICKLQYPPEHSWNKVSGNRIRKICSFFWVILKMFWYIEIVF